MAKTSIKHLQIDKNQTTILGVIALSTIIVVFGLFATKALVTKGLYQSRALSARRSAAADLKTNVDSAKTLFTQYQVFAEQNPNVLTGTPTGSGSRDGENPRIVLDALPSVYDAPALGTSIEKIMTDQNIDISSLTIRDEPEANPDKPDPKPQPKTISFSLTGSSTYAGITQLLRTLEQSIRPFNVTTLQLSGTDNALQITASIDTYYQPAKSLDLTTTKEVK